MYTLRNAKKSDEEAIRMLIHQVRINPMDLNWPHFVVVTDENDALVACGQIKQHRDGSHELASIAVTSAHRGKGLAGQIIRYLRSRVEPPLYLTCRGSLQPFYEKYGFAVLLPDTMPPYFRRIWRFGRFVKWLRPSMEELLVMGIIPGG